MLFVNSSRRDKSFLRREISSTQRIEYIKFHHREIVVKRSNILIPRSSKVSLGALHARIHSILRISQSATFIRFELQLYTSHFQYTLGRVLILATEICYTDNYRSFSALLHILVLLIREKGSKYSTTILSFIPINLTDDTL